MRNDENLLDETEVRSFLSGLAFVREFSINVVSVKPGSVTVELPFDERFSGPPKLFPASMGDVAVLISLLWPRGVLCLELPNSQMSQCTLSKGFL